MALWGGRFESGPDALFREFNDSLRFDFRLAPQDIKGSIGWAGAIHRAGVLSDVEHAQLVAALGELSEQIASYPLAPLATGAEDIHSWVESRLIERVGALGKKLHTGRSRNDQVATDLRLWTRDEIDRRVTELRDLRRSLIDLAERERETVVSGYTHMQRAQPVLFSHWALAYLEMFERDSERFADARRRVNFCPLGSGALAGTAYRVDREQLARDLGFDAATRNSLDAVSDRDFVIETLAASSICAAHLSRMGEDLVLYSSQEFGFVEMHDSVASGSSLMPQKKNPDAAELLRGKAGRINGALMALLTTVKGLPLAYNKDLQEDKEPLFDAMDHLSMSLRIAPRMLDTLKVRRDACRKAAAGGYSNATDLADYLVAKGVPFRDAHEQVGAVVRHAISRAVPIELLELSEIQSHSPDARSDVFEYIAIEAGMARREVHGATGPAHVKAAIDAARHRLGSSGGPA
jgi:argininosuccinate lyase/amino-acid N-acetyltransferase